MTHKCDKCGNTTELELKMGGLICADCRVILFFPHAADGVWAKEFKKMREEYDKKVRSE
jgi:hypothetical protein